MRKVKTALSLILQVLYRFGFKLFKSGKAMRIWDKAAINAFNESGRVLPCPYCGGDKSAVYYRRQIDGDSSGIFDNDIKRLDFLYGLHIKSIAQRSRYFQLVKEILTKTQVSYMKCPRCGLIYQNYPHEEAILKNYYNRLYRSMYANDAYGRGKNEKFSERKNLTPRYLLEKTGLPESSKILDIGCAEGIVCSFLKDNGMIPYGIDPCLQEIDYSKEHFKLDNVKASNYGLESYPPQSFDAIMAHHTLEHMLNVKATFEAVRRHLKPGGYLLLRCPQILESKEYGNKGLNGGLHIHGFTREFLVNALNDFNMVEILETPFELKQDFPWVHLDEPVSPWGDTAGSISILCRKDLEKRVSLKIS